MSADSVALFRSAGSVIIALLFVISFWIVVIPMFEGDKKKKRMEAVATARENMRKSYGLTVKALQKISLIDSVLRNFSKPQI